MDYSVVAAAVVVVDAVVGSCIRRSTAAAAADDVGNRTCSVRSPQTYSHKLNKNR